MALQCGLRVGILENIVLHDTLVFVEHADEAQGMLAKMMMDAMEDCIAVNAAEEKSDRKIADKVKWLSSVVSGSVSLKI